MDRPDYTRLPEPVRPEDMRESQPPVGFEDSFPQDDPQARTRAAAVHLYGGGPS